METSNYTDRFFSWARFIKNSRSPDGTILRSREFKLGSTEFWLMPFSELEFENSKSVEILALWRESAEFAYPSRFTITTEGTKKWLQEQVTENPNRVMYWVVDKHLNRLGHLGLLLNSDGRLEVDNVLKAVVDHPGLFTSAMLELEGIVLDELGTRQLSLKVLGSNEHAIQFYSKLGYAIVEKIGMDWINEDGRKFLVESDSPTESICIMEKKLRRQREVPDLILTAGPFISNLESVYVNDAVTRGWNAHHSDYITRFEAEFAEMVGAKYAMATSSCTGALHLALLSLGIGPGDEVIVPDITWVATASAVAYTGATPIFSDVEGSTWNMSVNQIQSLVTSRTKAIIPVHLYGYAAPMIELRKFAEDHELHVVEDAAPAIGTQIGEHYAGTFGEFGCYSFQGAKLLVTGEGGMLVTNDEDLHAKAWKIQDHGRRPGTFWIEELGHKYKMNNITAALGLAQLQRAAVQIERKREINSIYRERLKNVSGITFQEELEGTHSICWMSSITLGEKISSSVENLSKFLRENGVDTRPVFPTIHSYPMWASNVENPTAARISSRSINLPSGVMLSDNSIYKVTDLISEWVTVDGK